MYLGKKNKEKMRRSTRTKQNVKELEVIKDDCNNEDKERKGGE